MEPYASLCYLNAELPKAKLVEDFEALLVSKLNKEQKGAVEQLTRLLTAFQISLFNR